MITDREVKEWLCNKDDREIVYTDGLPSMSCVIYHYAKELYGDRLRGASIESVIDNEGEAIDRTEGVLRNRMMRADMVGGPLTAHQAFYIMYVMGDE